MMDRGFESLNEIWTKISRNPKYSISSDGRVRNDRRDYILKPRPDAQGYHRVSIYDNVRGKYADALVHRLVAEGFYGGMHDDLDVNHKDGDKQNNRVDNLEWCTRSENLKHCYATGLRPSPQNRCRAVRIIETGETFDSVRQCARHLNCSHSNISLCLNGIQKSCRGYRFEFVE